MNYDAYTGKATSSTSTYCINEIGWPTPELIDQSLWQPDTVKSSDVSSGYAGPFITRLKAFDASRITF